MFKLIRFLVVSVLFVALPVLPAVAQGFIRDAEIENTIRAYSTPIFTAAGLDPASVRIHLIGSDQLNAFVAGGQRLFIFTGLLMEAEEPGEVIGVIAHEAGHIAGSHLARIQEELRNAQIKSILAMVLGGLAGAASGEAGAAGAVISAGNQSAQGGLLQYSRTQESAADAAGLKYLDRTGQSAEGIYTFLKRLESQMFLTGIRVSPYLSTHPLTTERISTVRNHLTLSRFADAKTDPSLVTAHKMMRAKLIGFTRSLTVTLRTYPETDTSIPARYARAIAWHRRPDLGRALALIDGLIAEMPDNPYFWELKGQILFESGKIAESIPPYEKAVSLAPDEPLIVVGLARAQVQSDDPALTLPALENLKYVVRFEPGMRSAWRMLTIVYSRLDRPGDTALAQAEYSLLNGEGKQARALAERAETMLPRGSPGWLRSQDILTQVGRSPT